MNNLNFISAEIFISLSIMFLLILGVFKKNSSSLIHNLAIGLLLITGILIFANSKQYFIALNGRVKSCLTLENLSSCAAAIILPSIIIAAALSW